MEPVSSQLDRSDLFSSRHFSSLVILFTLIVIKASAASQSVDTAVSDNSCDILLNRIALLDSRLMKCLQERLDNGE